MEESNKHYEENKRVKNLIEKVQKERFPELEREITALGDYYIKKALATDGSTIYWNPGILRYEDKALEGAIGHELAHITKGHCKWYNLLLAVFSKKRKVKREIEANDEVVARGLGENLDLFYSSKYSEKYKYEKKGIRIWTFGNQIALTVVLNKDKVRAISSQGRKKKFWWVG